MAGNTFNENYAGKQKCITDLVAMCKIYIEGDTYYKNSGVYREALNKYGTIKSQEGESDSTSILNLHEFFIITYPFTDFNEYFTHIIEKQYYYPMSPTRINSAMLLSIENTVFDNNQFQQYRLISQTISYHASAILLQRWVGQLILNSVTFKNYNGMSAEEASAITGNNK